MTKRKRITRKGTEHAVFGQADSLPAYKLPLNGEVLRNCWRYKCEAGMFPDVNEIVKKAALDVSAISVQFSSIQFSFISAPPYNKNATII